MKTLAAALALCLALAAPAAAADVVASWGAAVAPAAPETKPVQVDTATTALLVLDIEEFTCNAQRRPRCLDTVPAIAALAAAARAKGMAVVYSLTRRGTPETILPPVQPAAGDPVVQAGVDKFLGTDLEAILKAKGIKTVIVTGTAAHGAVLHTATAAAQRGLNVVLPADGLSAETLYIEQASVWLLLEGPGTKDNIALTRCSQITIR